MEAPNKVYLHPTAKGEVGKSWLKFPLTNEDVEYTRTDVIVEKALKWMETFLNTHYVMRYRDSCEPIHDAILEGFGEYMKGEKE